MKRVRNQDIGELNPELLQYYCRWNSIHRSHCPPTQLRATTVAKTPSNRSFASSKELGIVMIDSIRGMVRVIIRDFALSMVGKDVMRRSHMEVLSGKEDSWVSHLLYVNRF